MRSLCFSTAAAVAFAMADSRIYQLPLGHSHQRRASDVSMDILSGLAQNPEDVDLDALYQARGVQYADLKVGCPAQSQSAIISTASSAIGFPCSGCTNDCGEGSHLNGLYHEKQSTCFSEVACGNCRLSSYSCTARQCPVSMHYLEGSSWSGREVEDMVSVGGEDSDEEAFPLRFGCQNDITGLFEDQIPDGIFGMNKEKGSAISQWSDMGYLDDSAFSLCYNVREDVKVKSGVMMLGGSDERLHLQPMRFAKDVGTINYEVRLKGITLRRGPGLDASVAPTTVAPLDMDGTDTALLDSGTTCSYLAEKWHGPLKQAFLRLTGRKHEMFSHLHITDDELNELPTIIFEMEGTKKNETITVEYPPIRYMEKSEYGSGWDFCLYASDYSTTLGNTFMAGHDVLHDLDNKRIGFAESTCHPSIIGITLATDGDENEKVTQAPITTQPPIVGVQADGPTLNNEDVAAPVVAKFKPILLQSEPAHKRKRVNPTAPGFDVLYAFLALCVLIVAIVLYRRHRGKILSGWVEPSTKHAYQLSWISLVLTLAAIAAGFALFSSTGSSLFLVLALENCVDFLSSAVVLWRFFAPSDVTDKLEAQLHSREKRASVAISVILVVLGIGIWVSAIQDILRGKEDPGDQKTALGIAFISFFLFGILTAFKFQYAKALNSPSLYKDGLCSLIGTTLSASLFVDTLIIRAAPSVWYIDPIVAIGCGFVSLLYGVWSLYVARYRDGLPICSSHWWFQGDEEPEEMVTRAAAEQGIETRSLT